MAPAKGYYSILQYVPDLERVEGANIGIVLFCPTRNFLSASVDNGNSRVRRFFGPDVKLDLERLAILKATFAERVQAESERITTPDAFYHSINTRAQGPGFKLTCGRGSRVPPEGPR